MVPVNTFELREGHRVEMLLGMATVRYVTPDKAGGYIVGLRYEDGAVHTVRNVEAGAIWHVEL